MDGMTYQPALPGIRIPDRSPLDMPSTQARAVLQAAAAELKKVAKARNCMADEALADALLDASCGNNAAAFEALQAASALRAMRA